MPKGCGKTVEIPNAQRMQWAAGDQTVMLRCSSSPILKITTKDTRLRTSKPWKRGSVRY